MKRTLTAAAAAAMAATALACGSGGAGGSPGTLTVWLMEGSAPREWVTRLNEAFERRYGVAVQVEIQQWDGIQNRLTTALSEDGTVDVLEIGNTQTPGYAHAGGLADLSAFEGEPWTESMLSSARAEGTLYAVPWWGASRVVIYDKSIWAEAGAGVPATRTEWIEALRAVEKNTTAEPIYLPGQSYYVLGGFIADEGGGFAAGHDGEWRGTLNTPEARAGMDFYRKLYSFSSAPADADEASPQQSTEIIPHREIASWIGLGWEASAAAAAREEDTASGGPGDPGDEAGFGYFPVPGTAPGRPGHVFLGGSHLAVSERAGSKEKAVQWLRMATGRTWSQRFADAAGGAVVPGRSDVTAGPEKGGFAEAMALSAGSGYLPPPATGWAYAETEPNPIKEFMTKVLNGEDYPSAADDADAEITERLNRE